MDENSSDSKMQEQQGILSGHTHMFIYSLVNKMVE